MLRERRPSQRDDDECCIPSNECGDERESYDEVRVEDPSGGRRKKSPAGNANESEATRRRAKPRVEEDRESSSAVSIDRTSLTKIEGDSDDNTERMSIDGKAATRSRHLSTVERHC